MPSEAVIAFLGVLVGSVITGFVQYWISSSNRQQQLRLAALDKRLQAHQEAYTWWQRLRWANRQTDEFAKTVMGCQEWWLSNCLYLTPEARDAFRRAYLAAPDHAQLVATHADIKLIIAANNDVERAGKIIFEGVFLPSIAGELEKPVNT